MRGGASGHDHRLVPRMLPPPHQPARPQHMEPCHGGESVLARTGVSSSLVCVTVRPSCSGRVKSVRLIYYYFYY